LSGKEMTIISKCYLRLKVKCPIFPLMLNILVITTKRLGNSTTYWNNSIFNGTCFM